MSWKANSKTGEEDSPKVTRDRTTPTNKSGAPQFYQIRMGQPNFSNLKSWNREKSRNNHNRDRIACPHKEKPRLLKIFEKLKTNAHKESKNRDKIWNYWKFSKNKNTDYPQKGQKIATEIRDCWKFSKNWKRIAQKGKQSRQKSEIIGNFRNKN